MVMGMIGVSGVWNLPDQDGPDAAIWRLAGPLIRQLDPWDPGHLPDYSKPPQRCAPDR